MSLVSISNFWFINMVIIQYTPQKANIGPAVTISYITGNKRESIKADNQFTIVGIVINVGYDIYAI